MLPQGGSLPCLSGLQSLDGQLVQDEQFGTCLGTQALSALTLQCMELCASWKGF